MKIQLNKENTSTWLLCLIIIVGFIGRIGGLDIQSLWVDELHTMNEASPDISWKDTFDFLYKTDQHPPLHFIICKIFFKLFGHTAVVARIPSAIAGTFSIWAIYLLGRELWSKRLGLIAASLTAVNIFNLYYSQEARNYVFAFLFATLSYLFLVRLIRTLSLKNTLWYSVFALSMIYSHYYGLMTLASQIIVMIVFFFAEAREKRILYFRRVLTSGMIIGAGYAVWLPYLQSMSNIQSFWIAPIPDSFMIDYLYEYFGNSNLLKPLVVLLLITFFVKITTRSGDTSLKDNKLVAAFSILLIWLLVTYIIPYLRSLLVLPMLFPRYTIVVLPAYLIAVAFGIELIEQKMVRGLLLFVFLFLSLFDIVFVREYYVKPDKSQFREMTGYIAKNNKDKYIVLNPVAMLHYYFDIKSVNAPVYWIDRAAGIDSIVKRSPAYDVNGFWMIGGHKMWPLNDDEKRPLQERFMSIARKEFYDAWAELFITKAEPDSNTKYIKCNNYSKGAGLIVPQDSTIVIWGGSIFTNPIKLAKGKYHVTLSAKSNAVKKGKEYARLEVYANNKYLGDLNIISDGLDVSVFDYEAPIDNDVTFGIKLANDYSDPEKNEDLNASVYLLIIKKVE